MQMYYIIQNFNALKEAAEHRNIQIGEEKTQHTLPILKTSAKSVQTTRVVSSNFSRSLFRLQLKSPESTTYLQI